MSSRSITVPTPSLARKEINNWVGVETNNQIKDLLAPGKYIHQIRLLVTSAHHNLRPLERCLPIPTGSITEDTSLIVANGVYFNAAWDEPFHADYVFAGNFTTAQGKHVMVSYMTSDRELPYAKLK